MNKNTNTKVIGELFPKSGAAISEKLAVEQFNEFSADVAEIEARLDAQKQANEKLKADYAAEKANVTAEEAKVKAAEEAKVKVEESLATLTKERDTLASANNKLQEWYDKEHAKGANPPAGDQNKGGKNEPITTHSAVAALEMLGL